LEKRHFSPNHACHAMPNPSVLYLIRCGHAAPSADNSQPWHFFWDGSKVLLDYDTQRALGTTFGPHDPATLLTMGGVLENMLQGASENRWPVSVTLFPRSKNVRYAAIEPLDVAAEPARTESSLFQRHTNRFPYRKEGIESRIMRELHDLGEGGAHLKIFEEKEQINDLSRLVESASQIRFQTREVHEWLGKSLRFSPEEIRKSDGLDIHTLALPPGGGLFLKFIRDWKRMQLLNWFGAYRLLARIDSQPVARAPAVIAVIAGKEKMDALNAGRLLVRTWNYLNRLGVAVHPYFVIPDQLFRLAEDRVPHFLKEQALELDDESRTFFQLKPEEVLYMLMRIGTPTRTASRSLRLPLDKVFTDLSGND